MTVHPALPLLAAAALAPLFPARARRLLVLLAPLAALWAVASLPLDAARAFAVPGFVLEPLRASSLSRLFGIVFCLAAFLGLLYGLHREDAAEPASALALAGASLGVLFAGDWITLFAAWEAMTVASVFLIWRGGTPAARASGVRYLILHAGGGSLLFLGILLRLAAGADPAFGPVAGPDGALGVSGWLILAAVVLNAAAPPLHTWLTDAYPECTVSGSVIQSAFTTKTAVFVLLKAFPGTPVLALWGAVMAVYGVVYAVLENDIRRLLAYHIVSQVGFMLAGVGLGVPLALDGAAAHAFCHILYKALLFMAAGAVIQATGRSKLSDLGGLGRSMPGVCALFFIGALSISGLPGLSGFVSKNMTIAASASTPAVYTLLELASVGTFLSIGLKLGYFAFFGTRRDLEVRPIPRGMTWAMTLAAALCVVLGLFPGPLYAILPQGAEHHPYELDHVLGAFQLHLGTAMGFFLLLGLLKPKALISLDVDWAYRKPLAAAGGAVVRGLKAAGDFLTSGAPRWAAAAFPGDADPDEGRRPLAVPLAWIAAAFSLAALIAAAG